MKAILIPMKEPASAKQRLAGYLTPSQRVELVLAMFKDVARTVCAVVTERRDPGLHVYLATASQDMAVLGESYGWSVLLEREQVSENKTVDWACERLSAAGVQSVLRIPADIPLVRPEDLHQLLDRGNRTQPPAAFAVASRDGRGTNALYRNPPCLFPSCFGPDSLARHRREAQRSGASWEILDLPRVALDVDTPEDLSALLAEGRGTLTCPCLERWNLDLPEVFGGHAIP